LAPEVIPNFSFEVEHVVPTSRGGRDDPSNLALACRACNVRKGERVVGLDEETGQSVALFSPRTDRWEQHFAIDRECGRIVPLTPTGRATAALLDLNHPQQIVARLLWIQCGLYC
jgi:5-methylcytosine-specific restriction endonuclease McrA